MAMIHRRRLGSGEIVWELTHGTGKDRTRFIAGQTRPEAEAVLKQFNQQLTVHGQAPVDLSAKAALDRYLKYLRANRRPSTTRRYGRVLHTFHSCFLLVHHPDVQGLRDIKPAHIEDYKEKRSAGQIQERESVRDALREQELREHLTHNPTSATRADNAAYGWLGRKRLRTKVTARTVNYELRTLYTFLQWAVRQNLLVVNPATGIERFRVPKRALPKFMTSDELRQFFEAADDEERRLFMTILLSGMRRGEVEYLTWSDVSFELGVIFIREKPDLDWQPKTDERVIPMSPVLLTVVQDQYAHRRSDRWVFANRDGNRDTHILEKLKKICRRARIRSATVHALRHSFGAHLRMAGVSLADIADLLGHKDLATTQIYAKVQQEHLRKEVSKLASLVSAPNGERRQLPSAESDGNDNSTEG